MKNGAKPLLYHTIHTAIAFYIMVIALFFGSCFGIDDLDQYSFFYRYNENTYTILYHLYELPVISFFILLILLGSFQPVPYVVMYWIKYRNNPGLGNVKKGISLSAIVLGLILAHPIGTAYFFDTIVKYFNTLPGIVGLVINLVIFLFIVATTYILPYLFIRLSCPQLKYLHKYKSYIIFLTTQLIIYLLLIAYLMGPWPETVHNFFYNRYFRWYGG